MKLIWFLFFHCFLLFSQFHKGKMDFIAEKNGSVTIEAIDDYILNQFEKLMTLREQIKDRDNLSKVVKRKRTEGYHILPFQGNSTSRNLTSTRKRRRLVKREEKLAGVKARSDSSLLVTKPLGKLSLSKEAENYSYEDLNSDLNSIIDSGDIDKLQNCTFIPGNDRDSVVQPKMESVSSKDLSNLAKNLNSSQDDYDRQPNHLNGNSYESSESMDKNASENVSESLINSQKHLEEIDTAHVIPKLINWFNLEFQKFMSPLPNFTLRNSIDALEIDKRSDGGSELLLHHKYDLAEGSGVTKDIKESGMHQSYDDATETGDAVNEVTYEPVQDVNSRTEVKRDDESEDKTGSYFAAENQLERPNVRKSWHEVKRKSKIKMMEPIQLTSGDIPDVRNNHPDDASETGGTANEVTGEPVQDINPQAEVKQDSESESKTDSYFATSSQLEFSDEVKRKNKIKMEKKPIQLTLGDITDVRNDNPNMQATFSRINWSRDDSEASTVRLKQNHLLKKELEFTSKPPFPFRGPSRNIKKDATYVLRSNKSPEEMHETLHSIITTLNYTLPNKNDALKQFAERHQFFLPLLLVFDVVLICVLVFLVIYYCMKNAYNDASRGVSEDYRGGLHPLIKPNSVMLRKDRERFSVPRYSYDSTPKSPLNQKYIWDKFPWKASCNRCREEIKLPNCGKSTVSLSSAVTRPQWAGGMASRSNPDLPLPLFAESSKDLASLPTISSKTSEEYCSCKSRTP